jgi:hypothetical protein
MIVLTIDQRGSRRVGDRVPDLLAALEPWRESWVRPAERTVGDEVQGLVATGAAAVDVVLGVLRLGEWTVGVGVGPVVEPVPESTRAGAGQAFVLARRAVERAKSRTRPVAVAVEGVRAERAAEAEAVLTLLGAVLARRTAAGWQAVDAVRASPRATQDDVAASLGVTQQAVSQRLAAALWAEELAVRPLAARLLEEAG